MFVFALLACSLASAQQITGNIRGTVTDPSGAVVQNAVVSARQVETGLTCQTATGRGGEYLLVELPVGHYRLEITAAGFQRYLRDGVSLDVNETASAAKPVAGENDLAQNPFNLAAERGRSLFDARHRFVLSYQWSLPFWNPPIVGISRHWGIGS